MSRGTCHDPLRTSRTGPAAWLALAAGGLAGLGVLSACSNPLAPIDADYGERTPAERLRSIDRLDRDQYRRAQSPTGSTAVDPTTGERATTEQTPPTVPPPPESLDLTIEAARAATLEHNLDIRTQLIEPTILGESLRREEARFEAVFRPSVRHTDSNSPTFDATAANQQQTTSFGGGVDIPLRTGGRVSVDLNANRQKTPNNPFFLADAYTSGVTFSISQPLLQGAGRRVNTAPIRIAEYDRRISEAQAKLQLIRRVTDADKAYWELYAARKALEVRQTQFELAQAQLDRAKRLVDAGDAPPIEVTRAESGLAERLEGIVTAENAVAVQAREIKRIMNIPGITMDSPTRIVQATEPDATQFEFDGPRLADFAVDSRMEMLELELQLAQDFTRIETAKNRTLPDIALDYQYSFPGVGRSLASSVNQIRSGDFHRWTVGLTGNIPLGNEAALAGLQEAILRRLQRLSTKDARAQSIRAEVLNAVGNTSTAYQRILAARQSVLAAGRTLEAERRQFDAGARTSTDVLDAATRLAEAQLSEIRAIADYQIAQVDLAFATGTVMGAAKIDWAPLDPREGLTPQRGQSPGDPTPPALPFYPDPATRPEPVLQDAVGRARE